MSKSLTWAVVLLATQTVSATSQCAENPVLATTAIKSRSIEDTSAVEVIDEVSAKSTATEQTTAPKISTATVGVATAKTQLEEPATPVPPKTDIKPAKPEQPAFPSFKLTGFTQLDGGWYRQNPRNIDTVGDAQDGVGFRRARLAVVGKVADQTGYMIEGDFATAGRPSFFDVYVEQNQLPYLGSLRIGQYCQPFSVDAFSGFRNLMFLERSLPFLAMVPFRRVGAMAFSGSEDDMTHWAYGVYRTGGFNNAPLGDDRFATDFGDLGGYGFAGRVIHLLNFDEAAPGANLWHIGASYSFGQLGANDAIGSGTAGNAGSPRPFYQARTTPEFGPLGYPENGGSFGSAVNGTPNFVDTGRYEADSYQLIGLETLWQRGPWSLQAEFMATIVQSVVGPIFYDGGYCQVAYRPTGEHREYDRPQGAFKNPIPYRDFASLHKPATICGWGAWEIAARWSIVDLRNPAKLDGHYYNAATNAFTTTGKSGNGVLQDVTLGVTWFLNPHFKWQTNWIHAMLDNTAKDASIADLFVTRVQLDF